MDASSLRWLNFLGGRIAEVPVVALVTLRPREPGAPVELLDELQAQPGATRMTLGALSPESVSKIVREQSPDADAALCAACYESSGGNPLYVRELLRALGAAGGVSAQAIREAAVPSLADRVARRIARVAPAAPALTRAMAVLGDGGRLEVAAALAGVEEAEAVLIAHRLRRIELLSAEDPFAFMHPLVRRSVYDELAVGEREAAHDAAAEQLRRAGASAEVIATHLSAVRPRRSSVAASAFVEAANHALGRAAPEAAIRWLQRALQEGAAEPPRAVLLTELGMAEVMMRDPAAVGHLQEALELAQDIPLRARISVALTEILVNAGRWRDGRDVMAAAFDELGDGQPEAEVEVAAFWAVVTLFDSRLVGEFDRHRERFEALSAGDSWPAHALSALLASAAAIRGDRVSEVVGLVERALEGGRLLGERGAGGWASAQALGALVVIDDHDRALVAADELAACARRCGSVVGSFTAAGMRGWAFARRGDLASAEAEVTPPLGVMAQAGMAMMMTSGLHFIQDAILERPGLADLAELVERTELDPVFLETWGGSMLREVRGRMRLAQGDRPGAVQDLRALARTCAKLRFGPTVSSWRSALALALGPEDREEAMELVDEEVELARATNGLEQLRESVFVLEASQARLEHARSLVELGAALRRVNLRAEARERLAAGMELAYRCGAQRLTARAREELRTAGARPRRIASTGLDALTPSERRIASRAAAGASNPEIAQELYLSLKTVESHLYNAYSKVGLSGQGSRARLAELLDVDGAHVTGALGATAE